MTTRTATGRSMHPDPTARLTHLSACEPDELLSEGRTACGLALYAQTESGRTVVAYSHTSDPGEVTCPMCRR